MCNWYPICVPAKMSASQSLFFAFHHLCVCSGDFCIVNYLGDEALSYNADTMGVLTQKNRTESHQMLSR